MFNMFRKRKENKEVESLANLQLFATYVNEDYEKTIKKHVERYIGVTLYAMLKYKEIEENTTYKFQQVNPKEDVVRFVVYLYGVEIFSITYWMSKMDERGRCIASCFDRDNVGITTLLFRKQIDLPINITEIIQESHKKFTVKYFCEEHKINRSFTFQIQGYESYHHMENLIKKYIK